MPLGLSLGVFPYLIVAEKRRQSSKVERREEMAMDPCNN